MQRIFKLFSREVIFSGLNQFWRIIYGPVLLLFIPLFLSAEDQGFWFTFMSISALAVFADLGFNNIIMQFSAHESAFVEYKSGILCGDKKNIGRLSSLFRFVCSWIGKVSIFSFPVIFIIGFVVFVQKGSLNHWLLPWLIYLMGSALNFMSNSVLSFFEGFHSLASVQKIRFFSAVFYSILLITTLFFRFGLYAIAFASVLNAVFITVLIYIYFRKQIMLMLGFSKGAVHTWKKDILNLLWRYALSWGSGYLIFQIYTPLMFQFHGPVYAGKVGITISLWTTIFNISNIWMYVATPKLNMCVARKDQSLLDRVFRKNLFLSLATYIVGVGCLFLGVFVMSGIFSWFDGIVARFLPIIPILFIGVGWFLQIIVNALAVYLRAHKEEPLMIMSVLSALYISAATLVAAKFFPPDYFFSGFTSSYLWGLPCVVAIFIDRRKKWYSFSSAR